MCELCVKCVRVLQQQWNDDAPMTIENIICSFVAEEAK